MYLRLHAYDALDRLIVSFTVLEATQDYGVDALPYDPVLARRAMVAMPDTGDPRDVAAAALEAAREML